MLNVLTKQGSRKRLNSRATGSYSDLVSTRPKINSTEGLAHNSTGSINPTADDSPEAVYFSTAGYLAHDPHTDQQILQADNNHLLGAALRSTTSARGGNYLRQHLYEELLAQIPKNGNSIEKALPAAIDQLDKDFQALHPFNKTILEGVQMAVAFLDFGSSTLHVASNGGCRAVVGRMTNDGDSVEVVADIGGEAPQDSSTDVAPISKVATLQLKEDVDTIIIGSTGFWKEVAPAKAVLRVQHFFKLACHANKGSAAANLINYSLHCVTQRLKTHKDRRMMSLRSVTNLVSLHNGDKSQFKWGDKQPVRRRRGDVHDDLTAVVMRLDWQGETGSSKGCPKKLRSPRETYASTKSHSHWDLVRMVLVDFRRQSKQHSHRAWYSLIDQVLEQNKQAKAKSQISKALSSVSLNKEGFESGDQDDEHTSFDSDASETSHYL